MKSDINQLMEKRNLDGYMIAGGEGYSVVRDYLANGAHITGGYIVQKRGGEPLLVVSGMEIEEAAKSGLDVKTFEDLEFTKLRGEISDPTEFAVAIWQRVLESVGLTEGRIGIYGSGEVNSYIELVDHARKSLTQYEFMGETGLTLFAEAFVTKDADEIARMRSVASRTVEVQEATWDYIASHRQDGETVVDADGVPLTIGDVKQFIMMELMKRGLEDTGMIFAQGRDGGFPHSRGENAEALQVGKAIVFDLFPRELGGGYHHDTTRTWCIGHAPDNVQKAYDEVMTAFDLSIEAYGLGKPTAMMQEAVLDYFEAQGHPTSRSQPGTQIGYMHSLGHGVGLLIHERPAISHFNRDDKFEVGNCLTIEPGLYYPDDGYGIRVEDTYIITENGELESITPFRKDLVIPLKG